jgi:hypothetical protein
LGFVVVVVVVAQKKQKMMTPYYRYEAIRSRIGMFWLVLPNTDAKERTNQKCQYILHPLHAPSFVDNQS